MLGAVERSTFCALTTIDINDHATLDDLWGFMSTSTVRA